MKFKVGDKVKYVGTSFGEFSGEIGRISDCSTFGHDSCDEVLISLTSAPNMFYHEKNFELITD